MTERGFLYYNAFPAKFEKQIKGGAYDKVLNLLSSSGRLGGYYNRDNGEVAGLIFNENPLRQVPLEIKNLEDAESYKFLFWAANQLGNYTDPVGLNLTTLNIVENFRIRTQFRVSEPYNKTQQEALICYLADTFSMTASR
jgi:hypothetical protein